MKLSKTEKEAETIYKLATLNLIDGKLFVYMAIPLQKRSEVAARYLVFLIVIGHPVIPV